MRILSKILDNYYSNKLVQIVKIKILSKYIVDIKQFNYKNYIEIRIKKTCYNDKEYIVIFRFYKQDAFEWICKQQELSKKLSDEVLYYIKNIKDY